MNEKQIQTAVIQHWRAFGLPNTLVCAVPNQFAHGQPGLYCGVFDLLVIGNGKVHFLEIKTDKGKVSIHQHEFWHLLNNNNILCAITFGRDQPIDFLERWRIVKPQVARAAA